MQTPAQKKAKREYRLKNKDKIKEQAKAYNNANKEVIKIKAKQWRDKNRNRDRYPETLKYRYGLSLSQYKIILEIQNNKCCICNIDFLTLDKKQIHVDHCHKTGKVRGILCHYCNLLLGYSRDNKDVLLSAAQYLKLHE